MRMCTYDINCFLYLQNKSLTAKLGQLTKFLHESITNLDHTIFKQNRQKLFFLDNCLGTPS